MNNTYIQAKIDAYATQKNIKIVDLSNITLSLKLDAWSCFKARTGKCSLELTENKFAIEQRKPQACGYAGRVEYCRKVLAAMQTPERFDAVYDSVDNTTLSKCKCGHYFVSGQHRICVAKHKGLMIPVNNITTSSADCHSCQGDKDYSLF